MLGSSTLRRPERIVPFLSAEFLAPRIETLDGDVRGALMRALPAHDRDRLTRRLSPRTLAQVGRALASPPHAVGAVASDDFVALPLRTTVADCRRALALGSRRARERGVVIVDDESGAYRGVVTTAQLLDAPDATPVGRLLGETTTLAVAASAALGTVADVAVRRDADLLAVLGDDRRPVGVVTTRILLRHLVRHPTTSFDARLLLGGFVLVTALVIVLLLGYLTRLHR